jgi:hypothetical protein
MREDYKENVSAKLGFNQFFLLLKKYSPIKKEISVIFFYYIPVCWILVEETLEDAGSFHGQGPRDTNCFLKNNLK